MLWFITKLRRTAMRGSVKTDFPPNSSDQDFNRSASLALAMAARAAATFLSNASRTSFRDFAGAIGATATPCGARSRESLSRVEFTQMGRFARCVANQPIVPDLSWGFQPSLSSGTRSRVFRVLAISWSNSGNSASFRPMQSSLADGFEPILPELRPSRRPNQRLLDPFEGRDNRRIKSECQETSASHPTRAACFWSSAQGGPMVVPISVTRRSSSFVGTRSLAAAQVNRSRSFTPVTGRPQCWLASMSASRKSSPSAVWISACDASVATSVVRGRPEPRRRPQATTSWRPFSRISSTTARRARRARSLAVSVHCLTSFSASLRPSFSAAWYGCLGIPGSTSSMRRRSITFGERGGPATATSAAHPECARKPTAARVIALVLSALPCELLCRFMSIRSTLPGRPPLNSPERAASRALQGLSRNTETFSVEGEGFLGGGSPGEPPRSSEPGFPQLCAKASIAHAGQDCAGQRRLIVRIHQYGSVAQDLWKTRSAARHHGRSTRHRFQLRQSEAFEQRGINQNCGRAVERRQFFISDVARDDDIASPRLPLDFGEDLAEEPERATDDHELMGKALLFRPQSSVCANQANQVLSRLEAADRQHEITLDPKAAPRLRCLPLGSGVRRIAAVNPVVGDDNLFGPEPVGSNQVLSGVVRGRRHARREPGRATHGQAQLEPSPPREGFWQMLKGQVVDRSNDGRPAKRRGRKLHMQNIHRPPAQLKSQCHRNSHDWRGCRDQLHAEVCKTRAPFIRGLFLGEKKRVAVLAVQLGQCRYQILDIRFVPGLPRADRMGVNSDMHRHRSTAPVFARDLAVPCRTSDTRQARPPRPGRERAAAQAASAVDGCCMRV